MQHRLPRRLCHFFFTLVAAMSREEIGPTSDLTLPHLLAHWLVLVPRPPRSPPDFKHLERHDLSVHQHISLSRCALMRIYWVYREHEDSDRTCSSLAAEEDGGVWVSQHLSPFGRGIFSNIFRK